MISPEPNTRAQPGTPLPWSASAPDGSYHDVIRLFADIEPAGAVPVAIVPQRKSPVLEVLCGATDSTSEAALNAAYIIHTCNNYPKTQALADAVATLFDAIKHGDEEHQDWLKNAIDQHFFATQALTEWKDRA